MQMLYKPGTELKANNLWDVDTITAHDAEEVKALTAEGWSTSPMEACVSSKDREKVVADLVKKSGRIAEANARILAAQNLDATGSRLLDENVPM